MGFLRPEARATLWQWRETLIGLSIVSLGLWISWRSFGFVLWFGLAVAFVGLALAWAGLQRARFRIGSGGEGVVQIDEREITYFGPYHGGAVSLDGLKRLELGLGVDKVIYWKLVADTGPPLRIPVTAEGADALFDAFAALPGLAVEPMLAALQSPLDHPVVIWQKPHLKLY